MPDIIVNCPQCERPLRVPENLLGRLVKCPACGLTLSVPAGAEPQPVSGASPEPESPVSSWHPAHEPHAPTEEGMEAAPQRGDRFPPGTDERERARSIVMLPGVILLLIGILGLLADLFQVVWVANNNLFPPAAPAQPPQSIFDELRQSATGSVPIIVGAIFAFISILVIVAVIQMLRLRTYRFAVAGTVLAMVNFGNLCCVLGLPIGIWALIILSRPEVRAAFQMRSPPPTGEALS